MLVNKQIIRLLHIVDKLHQLCPKDLTYVMNKGNLQQAPSMQGLYNNHLNSDHDQLFLWKY